MKCSVVAKLFKMKYKDEILIGMNIIFFSFEFQMLIFHRRLSAVSEHCSKSLPNLYKVWFPEFSRSSTMLAKH